MRKILGLLVFLAGLWALTSTSPVFAQGAQVMWQCKTAQPVGWCPTSASTPLPVTLVSGSAPGDVNLAQVGGAVISLGQKTMTASLPVVIASNQSNLTVGIDQTTSGTTNAVVSVPIATATAGITSVSTNAVASNLVVKNQPGNLYGFSVTTGALAGFVFVSNTTTAPTAGGAAISPVKCYQIAANSTLGVTYTPPIVLSTGVTLVFSTTGCFTNTASATAFLSGDAK